MHSHLAMTLFGAAGRADLFFFRARASPPPAGFAAYPALTSALTTLPPPNASEGGFFFSLMPSSRRRRAWAHTSDLIDGTRDDELAALASGDDEVVAILETLVASQAMWDGGAGLGGRRRDRRRRGAGQAPEPRVRVHPAAAVRRAPRPVRRARRRLRASTLDKAPPPHALGAFLGADGVHFDGSIGVRVLFSFIVGALGVFNRLAGDLNRTDAASRGRLV
ncbi:DUF4239-containing protein [Aureococcus anophagefferens]|nr:DUF4239-containing protein [Aureococcus anophagefferens]